MSESIELCFDFGSPTTYLAYHRLKWMTENHNAELILTPVLLGGIFKATGNQSPVMVPLKGAWMNTDLQRYAELYQVPMTFNPHFPINTLYLMRGAIAAQSMGIFDLYIDTVFEAMWHKPVNMGDPAVVTQVLTDAGIDANEIFRLIEEPAIKDVLKSNTEKAVERGVFGCPATFFNDELYFGQDRLFFIERELKG